MKKHFSAYANQKRACKNRVDLLGNPIEMKLTFEEWVQIWVNSGHLEERGKKRGQYCMSRVNDTGHYESGNVFIQLHSQNVRDAGPQRSVALRGKSHSAEHTEKMATTKRKACTVDGVNVYPSLKVLCDALGHGQHGRRHPNFRYV